jgi:hypothetical protein
LVIVILKKMDFFLLDIFCSQESKLVMLPLESHSYQARESVLHMCAEMDEWLSKHLSTLPAPDP